MKRIFLSMIALGLFVSNSFSQECDVRIEILPEQYMHGVIKETTEETKKIDVEFTSEVMEVLLTLEGKNYVLTVVNDNCQAYCKRQKRVRQLNSGDENLVKNLIKDREEDLVNQIKQCKG